MNLSPEEFWDDRDKARDLFTHEDFVDTQLGMEPVSYLLAGVSRNLETSMPETVRAQHTGKAVMAGLTLGNYEYTPDDMWSGEGLAYFGSMVAPFYAMYLAGAAVGGRMLASIRWGRQTGAHGFRPGGQVATGPGGQAGTTPLRGQALGKFRAESSFANRARQLEDTWGSLVPQVSVEAGLWTMADPTLDGPKGYAQALAFTTVGQAALVGLGSYFRNTWPGQKNWLKQKMFKNEAVSIDNLVDDISKISPKTETSGAGIPTEHTARVAQFDDEVANLKSNLKIYEDVKTSISDKTDIATKNVLEQKQNVSFDRNGNVTVLTEDGPLITTGAEIANLALENRLKQAKLNKELIKAQVSGSNPEGIEVAKSYNFLLNKLEGFINEKEIVYSIPMDDVALTTNWIQELKVQLGNPTLINSAIKEAKAMVKKDLGMGAGPYKYNSPIDIIDAKPKLAQLLTEVIKAEDSGPFFKPNSKELLPIWKSIDLLKKQVVKELINDNIKHPILQAIAGVDNTFNFGVGPGAAQNVIGPLTPDQLRAQLLSYDISVDELHSLITRESLPPTAAFFNVTNQWKLKEFINPYTTHPGFNNFAPEIITVGGPLVLYGGKAVMKRDLIIDVVAMVKKGIVDLDPKTGNVVIKDQKAYDDILAAQILDETTVIDAANLKRLGGTVPYHDGVNFNKDTANMIAEWTAESYPSIGKLSAENINIGKTYVLDTLGYEDNKGIIAFVIDSFASAYKSTSVKDLSQFIRKLTPTGGNSIDANILFDRIIRNRDVTEYPSLQYIKNNSDVKTTLQDVARLIFVDTIETKILKNLRAIREGFDNVAGIDELKMYKSDRDRIIKNAHKDSATFIDESIERDYNSLTQGIRKFSGHSVDRLLNIHPRGLKIGKESLPEGKIEDAKIMSSFAPLSISYNSKAYNTVEEAYQIYKSGKVNKQLAQDIENAGKWMTKSLREIPHNYTGKGGKNTNILISEGARTQTTRNKSWLEKSLPNLKVGELLYSTSSNIQVPIKVTKITQGYDLEDFAKQGYADAVDYKKKIGPLAKENYITIDFEKVSKTDAVKTFRTSITPGFVKLRADELYGMQHWTSRTPARHEDTLFIFGDSNSLHTATKAGTHGTSVVRGAKNSMGIRTKKGDTNASRDYINMGMSEQAQKWIDKDIADIIKAATEYNRVVLPPIGQGRSQLQTRNSLVYSYLQDRLKYLKTKLGDKLIIKGEYTTDFVTNKKLMENLLIKRFLAYPDTYSKIIEKYDGFTHLGEGVDNFWVAAFPEVTFSALVRAGMKDNRYISPLTKEAITNLMLKGKTTKVSGVTLNKTEKQMIALSKRYKEDVIKKHEWLLKQELTYKELVKLIIGQGKKGNLWTGRYRDRAADFSILKKDELTIKFHDTNETTTMTRKTFNQKEAARSRKALLARFEDTVDDNVSIDMDMITNAGIISKTDRGVADNNPVFVLHDVRDSQGKSLDFLSDLKRGGPDRPVISGQVGWGTRGTTDTLANKELRDNMMVRQIASEVEILKSANIPLRLFTNALLSNGIWGPNLEAIYLKHRYQQGTDWALEILENISKPDNLKRMKDLKVNLPIILDDFKKQMIKVVESLKPILQKSRNEIIDEKDYEDILSVIIKRKPDSSPPSKSLIELDKVYKDLDYIFGLTKEVNNKILDVSIFEGKLQSGLRWRYSRNRPWGVGTRNLETTDGVIPDHMGKNMIRSESNSYAPRTRANVNRSDATILVGDSESPGSKLTLKFINEKQTTRDTLDFNHAQALMKGPNFWQTKIPEDALEMDAKYMVEHGLHTINGAGNRAKILTKSNIDPAKIEKYYTDLFNLLWKKYKHSVHITSGGQDGVDQIFLNIAKKLGQPDVSRSLNFSILKNKSDLVYISASGEKDLINAIVGTSIHTGEGSYKYDPTKLLGKAKAVKELDKYVDDVLIEGKPTEIVQFLEKNRLVNESSIYSAQSALNKSKIEYLYTTEFKDSHVSTATRIGVDYFINGTTKTRLTLHNIAKKGKTLTMEDFNNMTENEFRHVHAIYTSTNELNKKLIEGSSTDLSTIIKWHDKNTIEKILVNISEGKQPIVEMGTVKIKGTRWHNPKKGSQVKKDTEGVLVYIPPSLRHGYTEVLSPVTILMKYSGEGGTQQLTYHLNYLKYKIDDRVRAATAKLVENFMPITEKSKYSPTSSKGVIDLFSEDWTAGGGTVGAANINDPLFFMGDKLSKKIKPLQHAQIYRFVESVLNNMYEKADKMILGTTLTREAPQSWALTQEFVTRIHQILSDFIAEHGHKTLDIDWLKGILRDQELKHGIEVAKLPRAIDGLGHLEKRELERFKIFLFGAGEASRYNVPADALAIKKAKDKFGQLGLHLDKIVGTDGKQLYNIAKKIENNLKNIYKIHEQTGILTKGTAKSIEDLTSITGGLDKLLKDSAYRGAEFSKLQRGKARDIAAQIEAGGKGKFLSIKPNKFTADALQAVDDVKKIIKSTTEANMGRLELNDFALNNNNLKSVETKVWLSNTWNKYMDGEMSSLLTDFPDLGPSYMFKSEAKKVGMDQAADIHERFKSHILHDEEAAMKVLEEQDWRGNKMEKLYHLVRHSQGLDDDGLTKYHLLQSHSGPLSDLKISTHLRKLENEPLDGNFNLPDGEGGLTNAFQETQREIVRGVDGGLTKILRNRFLPRLIYSDIHVEMDMLGAAMPKDRAIFIAASRGLLDAENIITNYASMSKKSGVFDKNIRKTIFKKGNWAHEQARQIDDIFGGDIKKWRQNVENPAWTIWDTFSKEGSHIAANEVHALKMDLINSEWWRKSGVANWEDKVNWIRKQVDDKNDYLVHDKINLWTKEFIDDPNILTKLNEDGKDYTIKNLEYIPAVHRLKLQYDDAIYKKQLKAAEVLELKLTGRERLSSVKKIYGLQLDSIQSTNILSFLKAVDNTYDDILEETVIAGRRAGNDWAERNGHRFRPLKTDIRRIPFYKPLFADGPLQVGIKIRRLNKETGKSQSPWRDEYYNIGNFQSHAEATAYIKQWYTKEGKGLDKENTFLIIQPSESAYKNISIDELSRIDATMSVKLGDLDQIITRTDPSTGLKVDVSDIMPYVASQTRKRALTQQVLPTKFFEQSIFSYALRASKDGAFAQSYMMFQHLQEKLLRAGRPSDAEYLAKVMFAAIGRRSSMERFMNDTANSILEYVSKIPGATVTLDTLGMLPGSNNYRRLSAMMTSVSSFAALGFNISTALLQLSILGMNVIPQFGIRGWVRAFRDIKHVGKKNTPYYNDLSEIFNTMSLPIMRNDGSIHDIVLRASAQGTLPSDHTLLKIIKDAINNPKEATRKLPGYLRDSISKFHDLSMFMFNHGDRYPRMLTAVLSYNNADDILKAIAKKIQNYKKDFYKNPADYLNLKEKLMWNRVSMSGLESEIANYGKFAKQSADVRRLKIDFAVEFTRKTNHTYNTTNVPLAFTETTARPFLQFKTWVQKQSMFYINTFTDRPKKLGVAAYEDFLKTTGAFIALGGAFALPGTQEMDALIRYFWGVSPKAMMYEADSPYADLFTAGLFAGMGVSVEGRMGPGALHTTVDIGNIFGIYGNRLKKAFSAMYGKDGGNPEAALNYTLPKFAQNLRQGYELATTGKLQATYSNQLLLDYNKMESNSTYAALFKMIGFEDMAENKYRTIKYALIDGSRVTGKNIKFAYEEIFEHIEAGRYNKAREIAKVYSIEWNKVRNRYKEVNAPEFESLDIPYGNTNPDLKKRKDQFEKLLKSM